MNKENYIFTRFFLLLVALLSTLFSLAQNRSETDSLIRFASLEIYKNPNNAIRIANQIIGKSGSNIDTKIKAYKLISDAYSSKRNYEKSLDYVIKANELVRFSKDVLLKISVSNKTAIQYHQLKIYDKSIQYLDQAEQLILNYPIKDSIYTPLGKNYIVRGFIYKEKLNCDIANYYFDKGIAEILKANDKTNNSALSIAKYNKGNCYILMLNNQLANLNFKEAIEHAKIVNAKSLQAFALKGLAKVYTLEGNYTDAIKTLNEALTISADVNDLILNQEIYNGLSENYLAVNNWDQYRVYHAKYITTQNLIKQSERKSISVSLREKEKELNTKLTNQKNKFFVFIFVLIAMCASFFILYLLLMKRKKIEIAQLNLQIEQLQNEKSV
jgi:tetratricopeptide (TPR) repeat protein